MASNKEWRAEIEALSAELGVSVPDNFLQLGNPKLEAIGLELRGKKAAGVAAPVAESAAPPSEDVVTQEPPDEAAPNEGGGDAPVPPSEPIVKPKAAAQPAPARGGAQRRPAQPATDPAAPARYSVAPGQTLRTEHRGLLGALERVKAHEFEGGQAELDELVAKGVLKRQP